MKHVCVRTKVLIHMCTYSVCISVRVHVVCIGMCARVDVCVCRSMGMCTCLGMYDRPVSVP